MRLGEDAVQRGECAITTVSVPSQGLKGRTAAGDSSVAAGVPLFAIHLF